MGVYLNEVTQLIFELEKVKESIKNESNKDDYIKYADILRKLSNYFKNTNYKYYENKKYEKELDKRNKKNFKNIISNREYINQIDESLKENIKSDEPYVEHKEIELNEMILNIKYFLKNTDKKTYDLFLKMLAYEDLYETDKSSNEFIYDSRTRRSFIILKNTHDINAELNIIYMLSMLNSEETSNRKYTDYEYLNDFSKYRALYNELSFIAALPLSREDDVRRIYKKILLKAKTSISKVKKIYDSKNFKDLKEKEYISYIEDYRYIISLLFASMAFEDKTSKRKIDKYIKENNTFDKKMLSTLDIDLDDTLNDFKKCYTKHINR